MRTSQLFFPTMREDPADAEVPSHRLMLRAGMIRRVAAGIYTWLPLGLRVLRKVERIVREEMDATGAQEIEMPIVQPAELWIESNRWGKFGRDLLRMVDRHDRDFCLGPTHEEVVTDLVRREVHSYRQLPLNLYQIQTKFRDEPRPRFGVLRGREFLMKDGYSFHADQDSFDATYQAMYDCYARILERIGLAYRAVIADTGNIGGDQSHEFHVLADTGEDALAYCPESDYAANVERATALIDKTEPDPPAAALERVATPGIHTIDELCTLLDIGADRTLKTLVVRAANSADADGPDIVALVLRGDHQLNEIKAAKHPLVAAPLEFADAALVRKHFGCDPGFLGPGVQGIPVLVDHAAAACSDFYCGANQDGFHLAGANWGRDFSYTEVADLRNVVAGDRSPDGAGRLEICRGIEVGHIFQLGTLYSEPMGAEVLDAMGRPVTLVMGCYGLGVSRLVGAIIEQCHDEHGIVWPPAVAPFQVAIVPINAHRSATVREQAERLHDALVAAGVEVLLDDRDERPGVKFADIDLIGVPHRIVVGERGLGSCSLEYKARGAADSEALPLADAVSELLRRVADPVAK